MGQIFAYARVSTDVQDLNPQIDELRKDGFDVLVVEKASGASRTRPELARLVREMNAGDVLKVVRIDRLARSVSHLLEVIETLEGKGAHFRSLRDPIDTTTPQGMFSLQVLGAVAQLERALIADRSKAGLASARARGRVGGTWSALTLAILFSADTGTARRPTTAPRPLYAHKILPRFKKKWQRQPSFRQIDGCSDAVPSACLSNFQLGSSSSDKFICNT